MTISRYLERRRRKKQKTRHGKFDFDALPVSPTWLSMKEDEEREIRTLFDLLQETGAVESRRIGRTRGLYRHGFTLLFREHLAMSPLRPKTIHNFWGQKIEV